ncbi:MAG: hypothetical protein GW875_11945 [Deltaproteobacteria bacterium]|nr:hypothetical protein [Deltaproteobacteria bacterium]NCP78664.1 hypothetical protein [Desulfuromonadales bacterium]
MSKFLKVMIVLLTIAAVAAPAFAEDRLGLSGEMRVRGWLLDDGTDSKTYADQRLRIGGKFSIAEGVSVTFRTDVTERTWGAGGSEFGSGRMPQDGQQWDRAHMDLTMGNFHVRAGQQYVGYGLMAGTINSQDAGFSVSMKGPVAVSAFWLLDDQRGGTSTADSYLSAVNVSHKTDAYAANVFVGNQTKALTGQENVYLIGVNTTMNLAAIKLAAEFDYFTGDYTNNVDAFGAQLFLDASMAAGDAATVGAQLYYALAADDDGSEVQYQNLGNDFNGWDPIVDVGTNLSNEQINVVARPFDFTGDNAGLIGLRGYGNFKAGDALILGASLAYLLPEDDGMTNIDDAIVFAAGAVYKVMANTSLHAQFQYETTSVDQGSDPDDEYQAGMGLYVNF